MKSCILVALSLLAPSLGICGTFSIQGVQFISTSATDASIMATGNDVKYTFYKQLQTSGSQSLYAYPVLQSYFQWIVRWTGGPGETHPSTVTCRVATYGHGYANTHIYTANPYPGTFKASASLLDPFVSCSAAVAGSVIYFHSWQTDGSLTDQHQGYTFVGAGQAWTNIGGNTWESTADYVVNSSGALDAEFMPQVPMQGYSLAEIDASVTMRIIEVSGQTVDSDF